MNELDKAKLLAKLRGLIKAHVPTDSRDQLLALVKQRIEISIHQNVKNMAEGAQAIGLYIANLGLGRETLAEFQALLDDTVDSLREPVFVGSAPLKLGLYYATVIELLETMERYRPVTIYRGDLNGDYSPSVYISNIKNCTLFLGIYGQHYRLYPADKGDVGYIEEELRHAEDSYKRSLCFLSKPNVRELEFLPPAYPDEPQLRLREAPTFEEFHKSSGLLQFLWETLTSLWTSKRSPYQRRRRAREVYDQRVRDNVEQVNQQRLAKHKKRWGEMQQAHEAAKKEYDVERNKQLMLRKQIRVDLGDVYEFDSPQNLVKKVTDALNDFESLKVTGLAKTPLKNHWQKWACYHLQALVRNHLYRRYPALESPLERDQSIGLMSQQMELSVEGKRANIQTFWQAFIEFEWHQEIEQIAKKVATAAMVLYKDSRIASLPEPAPLPAEAFFHGRYEVIVIELQQWCRDHRIKQDNVAQYLQTLFTLIHEYHDELGDLLDFLGSSKSKRNKEWQQTVEQKIAIVNSAPQYIAEQLSFLDLSGILSYQLKSFLDPQNVPIEELKSWCSSQIDFIQELKRRLESSLEPLRELLWAWQEATNKLKSAVDRPRFGRCLFISGGAGVGKSHLVARVLTQTPRERVCPLYLGSPHAVEDWQSFLLERASLQLDNEPHPQWRNLLELDRYLSSNTREKFPSSRLLVLIDGVEEWIRADTEFLKKLLAFIVDHTYLHSWRFVITLSEYNYSRVSAQHNFWKEYGFGSDTSYATLPGWISLEAMNEVIQVWQPIIDHNQNKPRSEMIREQLDQGFLRIFNKPFIAWIIAELWDKSPSKIPAELKSLNFIEWVERYWDMYIDKFDSHLQLTTGDDSLKGEFKEIVLYVAKCLIERDELLFNFNNLVNNIAERLDSSEDIAKHVVDAFFSGGFLRLVDHAASKHKKQVQIDLWPFWHYWGAQWLVQDVSEKETNQKSLQKMFREWIVAVETGEMVEAMAIGLIEFTLLHLDRRDDNALAMTKFLLNEFPLWQNIVWRAAANATAKYQKNLGEWLDQPHAFTFESREAINHLMYFLKNARLTEDDECLAPHQRLRLLQRYYQTVALLNMIDYFDSLIERILVDWVGGEEVSRSLAYFHGTERFWEQEVKGKQFFQRLRAFSESKGVIDWEQLLKLLLIMLLEMSRLFNESRDEPIDDSTTGENLDERKRFWAYVVEGFCAELVSEMGLKCFMWLDHRGWFQWHTEYTVFPDLKNETPIFWRQSINIIHPNIWRMMSEQLTRAFGAWYWQSDNSTRDKFTTLVEILAGVGSEGEQAFVVYLLYHVKLYANQQQLDDSILLLIKSLQKDDLAEIQLAWKRTFGQKKKNRA